MEYNEVCKEVKARMFKEWSAESNVIKAITQKAMAGSTKEYNYMIDRINEALSDIAVEYQIPGWYAAFSNAEAIYHECFGFGSVAEWIHADAYKTSDTLRITGQSVFYGENGHMTLKPQSVTEQTIERIYAVKDEKAHGLTITFRGDEVRITKKVTQNIDASDIAMRICDTILCNNLYESFDPAVVRSYGFKNKHSFWFELLDGREVTVSVKIGENNGK